MKPKDKIQLVGGLLDLPITDPDGHYCGIVDDIEFETGTGAPRVKALLVGPGAYRGRMPGWAFKLARMVAGDQVARVPWSAVKSVAAAVELNQSGEELGLQRAERRAGRLIPRRGAI